MAKRDRKPIIRFIHESVNSGDPGFVQKEEGIKQDASSLC